MCSNELQFKNNNPGAVQYGNFINYYDFNPPSNRINLLPTKIWSACLNLPTLKAAETTECSFVILDIGCNAGNLTNELACFLQKHLPSGVKLQVLAVDIDPVLIQRANENYAADNIQFKCADCTKEKFRKLVQDFLKATEKTKFDAIFCFSTTMWIHLNYGDDGLRDFLKNISSLCEMFVVEPQPWKCYSNAIKRIKGKLEFPYFKGLKMCLDVVNEIEQFIINDLMMSKVFESEKTEWKRKIFCFKHNTKI